MGNHNNYFRFITGILLYSGYLFIIGSVSIVHSEPANYVQPGIGGGSTFDGATLPFGMVQFTPEKVTYNDNDTPEYHGFVLTRLSGTGCSKITIQEIFCYW